MATIRELSKYANNACERSTLESAETSASSPQVPWVPKYTSASYAWLTWVPRVPQVAWASKCLEYQNVRVLAECLPNALQSAQMGQNFGSLFA